jgi:hypothetical protein
MLSSGVAASMAACMVRKSVGTVIVAAFAVGSVKKVITINRNTAGIIERPIILFNDVL